MSDVDQKAAATFRGLRNLIEQIAPWLIDVGNWVFGGLIAVNLVVISALITVGPVDAAVRTATAALAVALPLNVAGIVVLRLVKDVKDVALDDLTLRAFRRAGFPNIDAHFPPPHERPAAHGRRFRVALLYSAGIAAVSIALTLTGIDAAVWHMGRWIAVALLGAVALGAALVAIFIATAE